ncbi:MAG: hypothetical protein Q4D16_03930 [Eubacteriales bacterium]|nr:hypothetical protein [Eubacteriales bacterium]
MKRTYRKVLVFTLALSASIFISGCGCGKKKEPDAQSQQVLKITITPSVAPTKAPDEMNPEAVVTNGNMTMVNEYLDQKSSQESQNENSAGE